MQHSTLLLVGFLTTVVVVVALALTMPTLLAAAPLWVMALCVVTGVRRPTERRLTLVDLGEES